MARTAKPKARGRAPRKAAPKKKAEHDKQNRVRKGKKVVVACMADQEGSGRSSKRQRQQLGRRDTNDQCERYKKRKLSHIDAARLKTIRNAEGESVDDFICNELRSSA